MNTDQGELRITAQLSLLFLVGVLCGASTWRIRLGYLGKEFFPDMIDSVEELPPKQEFADAFANDTLNIPESYYVTYFVKKISLVMDIDWRKGMTENDRIANRYLEDIPYVDDKKLAEKYNLYKEYKNVVMKVNKRRAILNFLKILADAILNFITINNIITMMMLGWIVFFMIVKNSIPTIWTLVALVGIACIGVIKFENFLKLSQTLILIPLFLNVITIYFANLYMNPLKCPITTNNSVKQFPCYEFLGIIKVDENADLKPARPSAEAFRMVLINILLYKFLTFLFKITETSNHLFKVRSIQEINSEIEDSFAKGNIPLLRIFFVKVASNFYLICYLMMIFVGSRASNITSMVLFGFLLIFVASRKPISTHWAIFYHTLNFIVICGFLIDLVMKTIQSTISNSENDTKKLDSFFLFLGLPSNKLDEISKARR